jgi:uncharacterized protein YdhG (YjbR/CyaY superfamily)
MKAKQTAPKNIDAYIAGFPKDVQQILEMVRKTIRKAAPEAEETISYQIPAFTLKGRYLLFFAGYKKHIGIYPAPIENADFKEDLSPYSAGKATVKFPLDKPIPCGLISKIVKFMAKRIAAKAAPKGKKHS